MDPTQELLNRIREAEHEAAEHYGFSPNDWNRLERRARTQIGKPLSLEESALFDEIIKKANGIFRGEKGYR